MPLLSELTLGFLSDLIAQHVYVEGTPAAAQRRRFNLTGFTVADDSVNEWLDITVGTETLVNDGDASLLIEYEGSAVTGDTIGVDINEKSTPSGDSILLRLRRNATNVAEFLADASHYLGINVPTQMNLQIADNTKVSLTTTTLDIDVNIVAVGSTNPASTGVIRLANGAAVYARNNANSADVKLLELNSSDNIEISNGLLNGVLLGGFVEIATAGTTAAASGALRLVNGNAVSWRDNGDSADIIGIKLSSSDEVEIAAAQLKVDPVDGIGFYGASIQTKQTVTGSRGGNAALQNLLTALANTGLITDSTT